MATTQSSSPLLNESSTILRCLLVRPAWWKATPPPSDVSNEFTMAEESPLPMSLSAIPSHFSATPASMSEFPATSIRRMCLASSRASFWAEAREDTKTRSCPPFRTVSCRIACSGRVVLPSSKRGSGGSSSPDPSTRCTLASSPVMVP